MSGSVSVEYVIRRKVFSFLGKKFHIYDTANNLIGFCKQKAFKLKEDIRVYTDESMSREFLVIAARSIIDFSAAYDVTDSGTGQKVGVLKRKGWKSILKDEWIIMDPSDNEVGLVQEDSTSLALVRRFLPFGNLIPQVFKMVDNGGNEFGSVRTHFNPFVHKMTVQMFDNCHLNPTMVLATGILLGAIEGRQQGS